MRIHKWYVCAASALVALWVSAADEVQPERKPNVVIIYGDDVGLADVGVYGAKMIPTPNIDRLASQGLVFDDAHCTAATCTPSRFSLLTGVHAFRKDARILQPGAPLIIPVEMDTLPRLFKRAGYSTAIIGKWHLGLGLPGQPVDWNGEVKPGPLELGFDVSYLLPNTNDRVPSVYLDGHRVDNLDPQDPLYIGQTIEQVQGKDNTQYPDAKKNPEAMTYYKSLYGHDSSVINGIGRIGYMSGGKSAIWNDETMADVFVEKARDYIKANKDQPFFLYFSSQDIHVPRTPHPRFKGKSELGYRGDAMVQFDWSTGALMDTLKELGLEENTIVIFSSDNGPVYNDGYDDGTTVLTFTEEVDRGHDASGLWRGGKYQIYEGGTRVPFIIRWPGNIEPGRSDALVSQVDLYASFAALLELELSETEAVDSRNALNAFTGEDQEGVPYIVEEAGQLALRAGSWKLVIEAEPGYDPHSSPLKETLFQLDTDPTEQTNVLSRFPERAKEMKTLLLSIRHGEGIRLLAEQTERK